MDDMAKLIPSSLPLETRCPPFPLRQYGGFWLPEWVLPGIEAVHTRFHPRPSDVFLASFPKSGTTWLKALAFATINRADHPPSGEAHPLHRSSPHDCVKFFESTLALSGDDVFAALPSPRLLATHIPYSLLPETITTTNSSGCRIVYISRDPKDTFVSGWLFTRKNDTKLQASTIGEGFELFCDGRCVAGPMWRHVIEYWEESQRRPEKVLFLRYEEMLREPARHVKRMADFLGCPFSGEEEKGGVVDAIVELCGLEKLKSLQVNKSGVTDDLAVRKESFFRKGVAGDWSNHISSEMAARLDKIVEESLRGSGFTFAAVGDAE